MKYKKTYRLTPLTVARIEQFAKEEEVTNTEALEIMIQDYFKNRTDDYYKLEQFIETIMTRFLTTISSDIQHIRKSNTAIDSHTQMLLEFWNHYFLINDFNQLGSTEVMKAPELNVAEEVVRNRISHRLQRKITQEKKRKVPGVKQDE